MDDLTIRSEAIRWLGLGRKTSGRLRDHLRRKGFSEDAIDDLVRELTDEGRLDDLYLATRWLAALKETQLGGNAYYRDRLCQLGYARDAIEQALAKQPAELDRLRVYAAAAWRQPIDSRKEWHRRAEALARRGFSPDLITEYLQETVGCTSFYD